MRKTLNKAQKKAVEYLDGPLLIVAGAGTGKTTVITEKIAYLIKNKKTLPENILALTFTDKAANEMEERVDKMLEIGYLDLQISTFHAFCQRILERYALDIGIPTNFRLLTETDAWVLMQKHLYDFELDYYRPLGNPGSHIHNLLKHFSKCKDELITPQEYLNYAENVKLDKDAIQKDEKDRLTEIANAYHKYNQILLDNNSLDFGDLIFYTVELLRKRPKILKELQERFKFILVDELQDVNHAQYELIKQIAEIRNQKSEIRNQLTVVGDDDQSIYAFRGASVSNILRFKEDFPKCKEIVLTENYRSGQDILDLAYKSIQNNNPDRLETKLSINKNLKSEIRNLKSVVEHIHTDTLENEVNTVIQKIIKLKKEIETTTWDDMAILVRANNHVQPFLNALEHAGIPYEYIASAGLYRQPIVLDCFAFLKVIENHYDNLSIYRLLRLPMFELTENDAQKFTHMAKKKSISFYEALKRAGEFKLSKEGVQVCEKILSLIHEGLKKSRFEKPTVVLYHFLEESGYLSFLTGKEEEGSGNYIRQIYHLKQFFDFISGYEQAIGDARVHDFVSHFEQILQSGDQGKLYQPSDTPDSVNILTVHGAKGLEFKYVFIVNLVEERFPTRRRGDAIELPDELVREQLPEGDYHLQEERRLFYVGMTRAKIGLFLTSADYYGGVRKKKVSRFLNELDIKAEKRDEDNLTMEQFNNGTIEKIVTKNNNKQSTFKYELPTSFSYSQIRAFQNCKYQYKLAYVLKIPMKGNPYFSFGNTMHATFQRFYEKVKELNSSKQESLFDLPAKDFKKASGIVKVPSFEELVSIYENSWIEDWYESERQRKDYFKKGKEILKEFYESNKDKWTIPVALEGRFKVKLDKYLINGRIDRIDQLEDGTLEIIDYKTGKSKEKFTRDDKDQLLLYKIAADSLPEYKNVGQTKLLSFYYLNDNFKNSFEAEEKDIEKLKDKLITIVEEICTTDFTKIGKKDMCGRCEFCSMGLT